MMFKRLQTLYDQREAGEHQPTLNRTTIRKAEYGISKTSWAVSAQVASRVRANRSTRCSRSQRHRRDEIVGVDECDVQVVGSRFDRRRSDFRRASAQSVHAECTRCLKPIQRNWDVNVTAFFPL